MDRRDEAGIVEYSAIVFFDGKIYSTTDLSKQNLINSIKKKPTYVFRNFAEALKNPFPRSMTPRLTPYKTNGKG
jgi:hypothetical protein